MLIDYGFPKEESKLALKLANNLAENAINLLLDNDLDSLKSKCQEIEP